MLTTPKPGWAGADVVGALARDLDVPIALDTDVNGAALAEWRWARETFDCLAYITVGTGVGVGGVRCGEPIHGTLHPELGHLLMRRAEGDRYRGACTYHGNCIEGPLGAVALAHRALERLAWRRANEVRA